MVTENVNIVFREQGLRVIKRNLDELGQRANNATRAIFLLQRAFFVLGGAGIARGLQTQLDQLTAYENRLRLTSTSSQNLEEVQDRLFLAANRSRSSFSTLAEIYSRVALSVKTLGVSQSEVLRVTETLSKASIISGANAREANLALVQLGQGLASDRLSGDELRSVLEQLPFVAQIIADNLGVTRGQLRELGREGALTAKVVFDALAGAADEVDKLFAQTAFTIGQALQVAGNQLQQFLDTFDDNTGFSSLVATGILAIANNLELIANSAGIAALATLGFLLDGLAKKAAAAAAAKIAFAQAINSGNAVLLGSVAAQQQQAAFTLAGAQADRAAAVAAVNKTSAQLANTQAMIANARAQVASTEFVRAGNQARILATGRFASLTAAVTAHSNAVQRLNILESLQSSQQARLSAQQAILAGTTTALAAATDASAAAAARAATWTGRLALAYPLLAASVTAATGALRAFFALIVANPLTIAITAAAGLSLGLAALRDATQSVTAVTDKNAESFRKISTELKKAGDIATGSAEAFKKVSLAQLELQRTEALQAQREAIRALADQIIGFNSIASDVRTVATLNFAFAQGASEVRKYFDELVAGNITLTDFRDRIAELGTQFGEASPRFLAFTRSLIDSIDTTGVANKELRELDAVIAFLSGTATNAQAALARMALGLDSVASSAQAAGNAAQFFISKIPELAAAARVQGELAEAQSQFNTGVQGLQDQLKTGSIDGRQYAREVDNLTTLFNRARSEIDGSAEAQRRAAQTLDDYNQKAEIASLTGLDRTLRQNTIEFERNREQLVKSNASQAELNALTESYNRIQEAARRDAASKGGGGGGGGSQVSKDLAEEIKQIERQIQLLNEFGIESQNANKVLQIEDSLKRSLSESERELVMNKLRNLEVSEKQVDILRDILGPQRNFEIGQEALNNLLKDGVITLQQYNDQLRELQINTDKASNTVLGGFRASIAGSIKTVGEFGQAIGSAVVGSINSAADAIVEFAKTGRINLRQLFADLFAQLLRLAAQQLLLRFVGSFLGIPGGGFGGFGGSSGGSVITAASGGSIRPTGPGSTDTRFVPLMTRPDERIDILTPQQQLQQREMMRGQNGSTVVKPQVNVAIVMSEDDILSVFGDNSSDTVIVRAIERNKEPIRAVLGG